VIDFDYIRATTLEEACSLISQYQDTGKILAGGQSLVTMLRQRLIRPEVLIDIYGIKELDYLEFNGKDGLRMGALTKHRTLEKSPLIKEKYPVLSELEKSVASVQTRNWGTIGGNICCADPIADPIPALIALGAELKIVSMRGERTVPLENFFLDFFTTVLEPDEILSEIRVPPPAPNSAVEYMKFSTIEAGIKIVSVSVLVAVEPKSDVCRDVKIVMSAVAPIPLFARKASEFLKGKKFTDSLLKEAAEIAAGETNPTSDLHASAEYRKELVKVLVKRATRKAFERAKAA
jgi:carbon-monoxide dehydrogenase medium subunit